MVKPSGNDSATLRLSSFVWCSILRDGGVWLVTGRLSARNVTNCGKIIAQRSRTYRFDVSRIHSVCAFYYHRDTAGELININKAALCKLISGEAVRFNKATYYYGTIGNAPDRRVSPANGKKSSLKILDNFCTCVCN